MAKWTTRLKKIFSFKSWGSLVVALPVIYMCALVTLPYVNTILGSLAFFSSSVAMIDGSKSLFGTPKDTSYDIANEDDDNRYDDEYVIENQPPAPNVGDNSQITSPESTPVITKPANAGTVRRTTYSYNPSNIYFSVGNNTLLKNCTSLSADAIKKTLTQKPQFKITADKSPEVLIMHTHTTEGYQPYPLDWFDRSYNSRTTDNEKNTVRVGNEIQKQLEAVGIGVIHDKTHHDYPSYTGSYERSAVTVKKILKQYPSIKIVLDVHRDAIQPDDNTYVAPVAQINGKSAAQVMIISGCDNGKMNMPKYFENLKFSALLQSQMGADYPGLARPILFDYRKYNQDLTTGSILLEMGGHGNSLDEAIYSGELVGRSLAKSLLTLK